MVVKFEKVLIESLARPFEEKIIEEPDPQVDNLVVKVASDKMQRKYEAKLNKVQSDLINVYAVEDNTPAAREMIAGIVESTLENLESYGALQNENFSSKAQNVSESIRSLNIEEVNDALIAKTLEIAELNEELQGVIK